MNKNDERMLKWLVLALKRGFTVLCIVVTLVMVKIQIDLYRQNSDEAQVEYKNFNTGINDPYPSIAFCLTMAIYEDRLKEFGHNLTAQDYVRFLQGGNSDRNMLKVDYEKVTTQWNEYILGYGYTKTDQRTGYGEKTVYASKQLDPRSPEVIMHGFREFGLFGAKCFSIDFPFEKDLSLVKFWLLLRPDVFLGGVRPTVTAGDPMYYNRFIVYPHYPKQFIKNFVKGLQSMGRWPKREKDSTKNYVMRFNI